MARKKEQEKQMHELTTENASKVAEEIQNLIGQHYPEQSYISGLMLIQIHLLQSIHDTLASVVHRK